jgi:hypothetical protein
MVRVAGDTHSSPTARRSRRRSAASRAASHACVPQCLDKNAEGLEIHRVAVDAAAHDVGSGWSLTLQRSLDDDQPRAATVSLSGPLG